MKTIKLYSGEIALIDDEDFEKISKLKWRRFNPKNLTNYAQAHIKENGKYKTITMHRYIMNAQKGQILDHINGNGLDNRKENLRFCTLEQNARNRKKSKKGTSSYKGVFVFINRGYFYWRSDIAINGKRIHIGIFKDEKEAAKAYNEKAKELFGDFAWLNEL